MTHWKTHKPQCAKWQEFNKKKDQQETDGEACNTVIPFLNQYSKEIDWDEYAPEKKERMQSEEGQREYIHDAMKTAKEVHKWSRLLLICERMFGMCHRITLQCI